MTINANVDLSTIVGVICAGIFILLVNITAIYWIRNKGSRTLIDRMMYLDFFSNLGQFLSFFLVFPTQVWVSSYICAPVAFIRWFFFVLNRLIPVAIATYRTILVCHVNVAEKIGKECLGRCLAIATVTVPILLDFGILAYRDNVYSFMACKGRELSGQNIDLNL